MIDKNAPAPWPGRVTLFGDPWHGLWTQSTGLIHTAAGPAVPTLGQAPQPGPMQYESRIGDAFGVQVPGQPLVERSSTAAAADAASGRSWPNYGILAGARRRLYGKPLHANQFAALRTWIYVDSHGVRWLMTIGENGGTELKSRRFGVFPKSSGEPEVAQTIELGLGLPFTPGSQDLYALDDTNLSGSVVALALGVFTADKPNLEIRSIARIWKIELAGAPPTMTATVTLVYFMPATEGGNRVQEVISATAVNHGRLRYRIAASGGGHYWQVYDINGAPSIPEVEATLPPGDFVDITERYRTGTVGASVIEVRTVYGAVVSGDLVHLVRIVERFERTTTATIDDSALAAGQAIVDASRQIVETYAARLLLHDGGPEVVSNATCTTTGTGTLYGDNIGGALSTWQTYTEGSAATIDGVSVPVASPLSTVRGSVCGFIFEAKRLSNRAWSLIRYNWAAENGSSDNASMGHNHRGIAGLSSSLALNRTLAIAAANLHGFASAHPITGVIDWDASDPRCWV